jgi:tRNA nucleotidyltransferase (CCA-adding enzyme)
MKLGPPESFDPNNPDHSDSTKYKITEYESTGRRPESVSFGVNLKTDMARRDLQINSMAIDVDGNIIDHFGGKKAIYDKVIKTVGNPHDRFQEDKLRMMRACRFSSKYCFDIDPNTKDAIISNKEGIKDLSPERIKDELIKMASHSGEKFANAILTLDSVGILEIILPEITKLKSFKETERHHPEAYIDGESSVFNHTIAALRRNKLSDPIINLSVLFHDIGKQLTYKWNPAKSSHSYHNHAEEGKDLIDTIAKRLKLSNKEYNAILFSMVNHMKLFKGHEMKPSKIIKLVKDENWTVLKAVSYCDDSCRTGMFDKKNFKSVLKTMEDIANKWGDKITNKTLKVVDGSVVMKLTGLRQGKQVGDIIKKVTEIVLDKGIRSEKEINTLVMKVYMEMK